MRGASDYCESLKHIYHKYCCPISSYSFPVELVGAASQLLWLLVSCCGPAGDPASASAVVVAIALATAAAARVAAGGSEMQYVIVLATFLLTMAMTLMLLVGMKVRMTMETKSCCC